MQAMINRRLTVLRSPDKLAILRSEDKLTALRPPFRSTALRLRPKSNVMRPPAAVWTRFAGMVRSKRQALRLEVHLLDGKLIVEPCASKNYGARFGRAERSEERRVGKECRS